MALFSRKRSDPTTTPGDAEPVTTPDKAAAAPVAAPDEVDTATPDPAQPAPEASVGISVSAFRGVGATSVPPAPAAAPAPTPPAESPAPTETVPGLRDNALLRDALAGLSEPPVPQEILTVVRQLLQGQVYLRVKGDVRAVLAEGKEPALAVATQGDQQFVLIYSGGAALQASVLSDGITDTTAMGQPALTVLRRVLSQPYAGVILDHTSPPARLTLTRDLLQRAVDDAPTGPSIKAMLAATRSADTAARIVAAIPEAPLWIAANRAGDGEQLGIAEARTPDGARYLELFTHPLEIVALGRGDRPVPITVAQLAAALHSDADLDGVLLDPAGPWIRLSRADLARVIALAG